MKSGRPGGQDLNQGIQYVDLTNASKSRIDNIAKNALLTNHKPNGYSKKSAASEPTEYGAKDLAKRDISRPNNSAKPRRSAMSLFANPAHKRVAKAIGYILTLGFNGNRAADLVDIFNARLKSDEKAGIAYAALRSMDEDEAYKVASLALFGVWDGEAVQ